MPTFDVTFIQYYTYMVEADDENEAEDLAHKEFLSDMRSPIAHTSYDEVEVEEVE